MWLFVKLRNFYIGYLFLCGMRVSGDALNVSCNVCRREEYTLGPMHPSLLSSNQSGSVFIGKAHQRNAKIY